MAKLTSPQAGIFAPDALEQIYAANTLRGDPTTSGLAYAFLKSQQGARGDMQDQYLRQLQMTNAIESMLEQAGIQADVNKTLMTEGVKASDQLGIPLDALKAFGLLTEPSGIERARGHTDLTADYKKAQIAKLRAEAANQGGDDGKETVTVESPTGKIVTKSRTPVTAEQLRQRHERLREGTPSWVVNPGTNRVKRD